MIFRRLEAFFCLISEVAVASSSRSFSASFVQVDGHQQAAHGLGADLGGEAVVAELVLEAHVLVLGQQLVLLQRASGPAR